MTQIRALFDLLDDSQARPDGPDWPPLNWVRHKESTSGVILVTHRSGLQVVKTSDDTIIVRREEGPEARRLANRIEDHLWGSGYQLLYGGGPVDKVAGYGKKESSREECQRRE